MNSTIAKSKNISLRVGKGFKKDVLMWVRENMAIQRE